MRAFLHLQRPPVLQLFCRQFSSRLPPFAEVYVFRLSNGAPFHGADCRRDHATHCIHIRTMWSSSLATLHSHQLQGFLTYLCFSGPPLNSFMRTRMRRSGATLSKSITQISPASRSLRPALRISLDLLEPPSVHWPVHKFHPSRPFPLRNLLWNWELRHLDRPLEVLR